MGAIVLDASKVNSYVLPNLNKSKTSMQEAYSTGQSLRNSLPSSFNYRSTVNEIVSQIYNIQKEISDIDTMISKKIDKAKTIENKASSKVSSIASSIGSVAGGITGAVVGGTVGAVGGAAAGAVVGSKIGSTVGKTIVDTGAKVVDGFVSGTKKIFTDVVNFFKDTGAKIANGVKSIWQKFTGTIKDLSSKVVNATKKVGKAIYNTGAKIVDGCVSGLKKFGMAVVDGFKWIGTKVVNSVKTTVVFVAEKAFSLVKGLTNYVIDFIKNPIATIGKTLASISNVAVSLLHGLFNFADVLLDGVVMLVGGVASIVTGIIDVGQAVCSAITGKEWNSLTKAMWTKGIMPVVGNSWSDKMFSNLYFENVYSWADKDDGIACKIGKAVGYVAGIALLTIVTAGAGAGVAAGASSAASATSSTIATYGLKTVAFVGNNLSTIYAGTAAMGKQTSSAYNELSDKEKQDGGAIFRCVAGGVGQGIVEGTTWYFTFGNGIDKVTSITHLSKTGSKMVLQGAKSYASEGVAAFSENRSYNLKEATTNAISNATTAFIYDKLGAQVAKSVNSSAVIKGLETKVSNIYAKQYSWGRNLFENKITTNSAGEALTGGFSNESEILDAYEKNIKYVVESSNKKVVGTTIKKAYSNIAIDPWVSNVVATVSG